MHAARQAAPHTDIIDQIRNVPDPWGLAFDNLSLDCIEIDLTIARLLPVAFTDNFEKYLLPALSCNRESQRSCAYQVTRMFYMAATAIYIVVATMKPIFATLDSYTIYVIR